MNISTKLSAAIVCSCLVLPWAGPLQAGKVYKWVDENGITHYGERKPTAASAEELGVRTSTRPEGNNAPPPVTGAIPGGGGEADAGDEAAAPEISQREARVSEEVRKLNCEKARQNLEVMANNPRIREKSADGEFVFLDEKQIAERKASMQKIAAENCN